MTFRGLPGQRNTAIKTTISVREAVAMNAAISNFLALDLAHAQRERLGVSYLTMSAFLDHER